MTDPYEQQLLAVFESCDVEGCGRLDREGLSQLCDQLHLEEGRQQLMNCLLPSFTFEQFRDALLTLLGASHRLSVRDPSPDREVSPKFVFGQKKYGRRSRPESTGEDENEDKDDEDSSDGCDVFPPLSQEENVKIKKSLLIGDCQPDRVSTPTNTSVFIDKEDIDSPRGQGEAELRKAWRRLGVGTDGYLDPSELAMVCQAVGMEKMATEVVKQVFAKLGQDTDGRISFEEFVQLFRGSQSQPTERVIPSFPTHCQLNSLDISPSGYVSSDSLAELWEAGGVTGGAGLLQDLGLGGESEVNVSTVLTVLEDELRVMAGKGVAPSPHVTALTAALILAQAQLKWTRSCLEQMTGQRDKLYSDLTEANLRATLLAQEVDERHARMERASQMQIKLLEQKHSEQMRQLGVQLTMDRDQLSANALRLEKRLESHQQEESRLRSQLQALQGECETLEKENQSLSEQVAACEVVKNKAEKDSLQIHHLHQRLQELETSSDEIPGLVEQLEKLQTENTFLRDRNDELTLQLETLTSRPVCKRTNSSDSGGGTKRRGHSPLAPVPDQVWTDDSPRIGKMRRCCTDTDLSMEGLDIGRSLHYSESGLEADLDTLDNSLSLSTSPTTDKDILNIRSKESYLQEIDELRATIADVQRVNEEYRAKLVVSEGDKTTEGDVSYTTLVTETTEVQTSLEPTPDIDRLEKHCYELRHTLEGVQSEIVKILSEKKACCEENCALKRRVEELSKCLSPPLNGTLEERETSSGPLTYTISGPLSDLNGPLCGIDTVKDSPKNVALKCFPFMNRKQTNSDSPYCLFPTKDKDDNASLKFENLSQFAFELSQSLSNTNLIVADSFAELESKPLSPCLRDQKCSSANRKLEFESCVGSGVVIKCEKDTIQDQTVQINNLTKEITELKEKCSELETSLDLMRVEYEKCEDYWQEKLSDERAIFDQEQRLSDEKFAELESKIQEYAELFSDEERTNNGRLPTIDERDCLEKQFTDLEEEFVAYKKHAEKEVQSKSDQLDILQVELSTLRRRYQERQASTREVGVQASEFRSHNSVQAKASLNVAELDCCCPCHGGGGSRKGLTRLRDKRTHLQAECQALLRRRDILLHTLTQMHHRPNIIYSPMPDRRLSSDVELFHSLNCRLRHQELRCRHLQSALKHHQRQTDKLLQDVWDQHKSDLSSIQKTLHITQDKLLQQSKLCKQQMERLASSDVLVKDLYKENAHLSALVQKLEERNLFVDQSILANTV